MSRTSAQDTRLSSPAGGRAEALRLRRLVADCARRRAAGEILPDEEIIRANPDLMPALERELTLLRIMKRAALHVADSRDGSSDGGGAAEPTLIRPDAIPGYTLFREIHRGGQGVVYEAEQASTRRHVAVKLLHRGPFASPSDRARFQREVSLLVRLRHPNIVAVHDTGRVGASHFIVMDLIEGTQLDRHLASLRGERWTDERLHSALDLLVRVCDAVHAAHLRGIIHRDLKPSNILIDATGEPHILDFGLAKDVGDAASDLTSDGQFVGSVPWASPEQVNGSGDADLRTDVYSLGVVFYEALTGRFPYPVTGPVSEVFAAIRTAEPKRPRSLRPELGTELDSIVLKCLSKEPVRRYESAGELARDLRHYLAGEPIEARRDSTLYVLSKHLRRYRRTVFAAGAAVCALAAFALYASVQAREERRLAQRESQARIAAQDAQTEAQRQQIVAARERDDARRARDAEAEERARARAEAERAAAVTAFLVDTLGLADPDVTQISDMSMREVLRRAGSQVGVRFAQQPESEAAVRLVIGRACGALGTLEDAREHLGEALTIHETQLESGPSALYEVLWPFVQVLDDLGAPEWRDRWWQLWRLYPSLLPQDDPEFSDRFRRLSAMMDSAFDPAQAERTRTEFRASAAAVLAHDDARWLTVADFLHLGGANLAYRDFPDAARALLIDALEIERRYLPETHTRIIRTLGALVRASIDSGHHAEAEALTRESLDLLGKTLPAEHWYIAATRARLGACLIGQRRFDEAERLLVDNLDRVEAALGPTSAFAREIVERLVDLYDAWQQPEKAAPWRASLALRMVSSDQYNRPEGQLRRIFDAETREVFDALAAFNRQRLTAAGVEALRELVKLREERISAGDPRAAVIAECVCSAANSIADRGRVTDATFEMMRAAEPLARASADLHPRKKAWVYWNLARNLTARRQFSDAESLCREALRVLPDQVGERDSLRLAIRSSLGDALARQRLCGEAEPLLVSTFQMQLDTLGPAANATRDTMLALVRLFRDEGHPRDALPFAAAVARDRWLEWGHVKPVLEVDYPELVAAVDALRATPLDDVDGISAALQRVLDIRPALLDATSPAALLYASALNSIARRSAAATHNPVWLPAFREVMAIVPHHVPPDWRGHGTIHWWLSDLLTRAGDCAAAEVEAVTAARLVGDSRSREALRGAAIVGLNRSGEAESILTRAFEYFRESNPPREPYFSECFAALLDLHLFSGRRDEAGRIADVALRPEITRRSNPALLTKLAAEIALRPHLPGAAYETARDAAALSIELRADNPRARVALAAAEYRLGRFDAAATALRGLEVPSVDRLRARSLLAMIEYHLGQRDAAEQLLAAAEKRLADHPESATAVDRRLLTEARALLQSGTDADR